ncbi:diacylglycerol kinase 7-like [Curcuma longa]|uniref:diacylglycerol kinase 7-like n=1 Tax=Curcuma longa TaxID=136217 RepID=UPI003D9F8B6C
MEVEVIHGDILLLNILIREGFMRLERMMDCLSFGMKQGWHASMVMVEIISAVHIAQAAAVKLELRVGDWNRAYLQTDGEPWKHPLNREHSTFLKIKRVPFQSRMINGK